MKPLVLLLALSLAANAFFLLRPQPDRASSARTAPPPPPPRAASAASEPGVRSDPLAQALISGSPETVRDLLRAAGVPPALVRAIIGSLVWAPYKERLQALQQPTDGAWWKNDPSEVAHEKQAARRALYREASDALERVLGAEGSTDSWTDTRLSFLPSDKRSQIQKIERDYQDLSASVQEDMQGFALPGDAEKLRFLEAEKQRDLEALMTPEERRLYALRLSPTARQLRSRMTRIDATEDEYLKLFPLQKAFDDTYDGNLPGAKPDRDETFYKERTEAQKTLNAQIKAALGETRYADYLRAQDSDYQKLQSAANRLALPAEAPLRVYALRTSLAEESQRIAANPNLAPAQKKEAYLALAARTRDDVRATFGAEAGDALLKNSLRWIKEVEKGNIITFSEDGALSVKPGLPKEPKPVAK